MAEVQRDNIGSTEASMRFVALVQMFATSALQQMGKLANPLTQKAEKNMDGARAMIDLLEMLQAKTRGNLTREEENLLKTTLASLQLTYVEELETEKSTPKSEPKTE
jgi:hypothetical protein